MRKDGKEAMDWAVAKLPEWAFRCDCPHPKWSHHIDCGVVRCEECPYGGAYCTTRISGLAIGRHPGARKDGA